MVESQQNKSQENHVLILWNILQISGFDSISLSHENAKETGSRCRCLGTSIGNPILEIRLS